ncbi:MAG: sensor histidine kinase [Spirochaetota bacterium]
MRFDPVSLLASTSFTTLAMTLLLLVEWVSARVRVRGLGDWILAYIGITVGLVLVSLQGDIIRPLFIFLGNSLVIGGLALIVVGTAKILDRSAPATWSLFWTLLGSFSSFVFAMIIPNNSIRLLLYFGCWTALSGSASWILLSSHGGSGRSGKVLGGLFALLAMAGIARQFSAFVLPAFLDASGIATGEMVIQAALSIILALLIPAVLLLVNARLREALERQVSEKELLFREMNHRTRNNLGIVEGLIDLQASQAEGRNLEALESLRGRVHGISRIHELLYKRQGCTAMDASDYLKALSEEFGSQAAPRGIVVECSAEKAEIYFLSCHSLIFYLVKCYFHVIKTDLHVIPGQRLGKNDRISRTFRNMNRKEGVLIRSFVLNLQIVQVFSVFEEWSDFCRFDYDLKKFFTDLLVSFS